MTATAFATVVSIQDSPKEIIAPYPIVWNQSRDGELTVHTGVPQKNDAEKEGINLSITVVSGNSKINVNEWEKQFNLAAENLGTMISKTTIKPREFMWLIEFNTNDAWPYHALFFQQFAQSTVTIRINCKDPSTAVAKEVIDSLLSDRIFSDFHE